LASDGVWTNGAGGTWSTGANWQEGTAVLSNGVAFFRTVSGLVVVSNDAAGVSLTGLTFNDGDNNAAAWLLNGNALALTAPGSVDVRTSTATLAVAVSGTNGVTKAGAGALRLAGGNKGTLGTTVTAGTLLIGEAAEPGTNVLRLAGGALAFVQTGSTGLTESVSSDRAINLATSGTNATVRLTTRMANTNSNLAATYPFYTQYIYTGRWYVPADASYSFLKNFDDSGYLAVDRTALINDANWNNVIVVRGIKLAKGWHDLEIRVAQGDGGVGPTVARFASGIMCDPTDGDFSATNMENAAVFADPGDGSVLRTDRIATVPERAVLAGNATLDLSACDASFAPQWAGGWLTDASAGSPKLTVVGGSGELRIGGLGAHAPFGIDAVASSVVFSEKVLLLSLPVSSPWRIVSGAEIALGAPSLLGTGFLVLTNHSVRVLTCDALGANGGPFTVQGNGNGVTFDASRISSGNWVTDSAYVLSATNDVLLSGTASYVKFEGAGTTKLIGTIAGSGSLIQNGSGTAELTQACGFTGDVTVAAGRLRVDTATVGAAANRVLLTGGTFGFASSVSTPTLATLIGSSGTLDVTAGQTLTVTSLSGTVTASGGGTLIVTQLAAGAKLTWAGTGGGLSIVYAGPGSTVTVTGASPVALAQVGSGVKVSMAGIGGSLTLAAGLELNELEVAENATATVSGAGILDRLTGKGVLTTSGPDTLVIFNPSAFDGEIRVASGHLTLDPAGAAPSGVPGVWLDVSVTNSYTHETQNNNTPDALDVIGKWYDCRQNGFTSTIENYNAAGNNDRPYVITNALNGKPVISCGGYYISPVSGSWRRVVFSSVNTYFVSMVFGSQQTGGHILGQRNNWDFQRGVNTNNGFVTSADVPIWKSVGYPVWTNGVAVNGLTTGLSGNYQVLSIGITNSTGHGIDTLGMVNAWQNSGGQRYAEVLLYTNTLSDADRRINESYLANKWGLGSFTAPLVNVASNATLEVRGPYTFAALSGTGTVVKTGSGNLSFGGVFNGSIEVQGGTVSVPPLPAPPTAEALSTNNLILWLDGCVTNRMTLAPNPGEVFQWIDRRTNVNRFAWGFHNASYPERPWLIPTTSPRGNALYWVDITTNPVYETSAPSKYMKITLDRDPSTYTMDTYVSTLPGIRTGFIVLDSSRGGGLPIGGSANSVDSSFARDNPGTAASPIWGATTAAIVTNGTTRLDGVRVDGRATGFNGGVQVLSFTTTGDAQFWFLGATKMRLERLGELMFFNTVLAPTNRSAVEAYLLNKWTAKTAPGYRVPGERLAQSVTVDAGTTLDLSAATGNEFATVSGAGTVRVSSFDALPAISGSIGSLSVLGGSNCTFTVVAQNTTYAAQPTIAVSGALTVPSNGVIRVVFNARPHAMRLPLLTYGSVTGTGFNAWTLQTSGDVPQGSTLRLTNTSTATSLDIIAHGSLVLIQ
jgi:autotransporter-associated beta strand protein